MARSTLDFRIETVGELPPQIRASIWDAIQAKLSEVPAGDGWSSFLVCDNSRQASQRAQSIRNHCARLELYYECKARGDIVYVRNTNEVPQSKPRRRKKT